MKHMDYIYLNENYYNNKKEAFTFLIDILKNHNTNNYSLLDLGCARGEFLYHIKKDLPKYSELYGIDYSEDLIKDAKRYEPLKGVSFRIGDAQNIEIEKKFDFITCLGLTGYFDSLDGLLSGINSCLKENGTALVFHLFNEFDVDVIVKYRNNKYFDTYEPGWNNHSIQTIKKNLNKVGLKLIKTHKFQLSIDALPKEDPARSWTAYVGENKKFINGLGLMFDLICLEISK